MPDFEIVKQQDIPETQKRYYNRKIHIEKRWRNKAQTMDNYSNSS